MIIIMEGLMLTLILPFTCNKDHNQMQYETLLIVSSVHDVSIITKTYT